MAQKQKKAPAVGPEGIDRWTTNGIGIHLEPVSKKPQPKPKKKGK